MRPLMHPSLVNARNGDSAVYVETLFEGRALLLDMGDVSVLPPRKLLRVEHVFVSHTHIDHFFGFDRLLRLMVGREKTVRLYGPAGFTDRVQHKLGGYEWNLVSGYDADLIFLVSEVRSAEEIHTAQFRLKAAFAREELGIVCISNGVVRADPAFKVRTAILEHRNTVSLAYAIEEPEHANVWKNRLAELGLPVGPWLTGLKRAVLARLPGETLVPVGHPVSREVPLDRIASAVAVTRGQKIAYVTDAADTPANRRAIIDLVHGADVLFIEAVFMDSDRELASRSGHLTTTAAGEIARAAEARRVEPFHFSTRYPGQEEAMLAEVAAAFAGNPLPA